MPGQTALTGTTTYAYDHKGQLTSETSIRGAGYAQAFPYDGEERRKGLRP